jgi:diaminopimelate decarboxylase
MEKQEYTYILRDSKFGIDIGEYKTSIPVAKGEKYVNKDGLMFTILDIYHQEDDFHIIIL